VLQCVEACCSMLQCVAVYCRVLQCISDCRGNSHRPASARCAGMLLCVADCCSVLQRVAVYCNVFQCVAVSCCVLLIGEEILTD